VSTLETANRPSLRRWVAWAGVSGSVLLAAYFVIPALIPELAGLLYSGHPPTTPRVVAVGADYHTLLGAGSWIQGVGAVLCVVFFIGVAQLAKQSDGLAGRVVLLGSAVLVAVVAAEMVFTLTWAYAATVGQDQSSRTAFDLMSRFIQVFPIVPAPTVYLALAWVLRRGSPVLPSMFGWLALALGLAFLVVGFVGALATAATAGTAALSGLQDIWILTAALVILRRSALRSDGETSDTGARR
jgi:hypothetical protein